MSKVVCCIVANQSQALTVVDELKAGGIPNPAISLLMSDKSGSAELARETDTKTPKEGALSGAKVGGLLGGALGLLVGLGTLVIPGVGPFLAAGPLMGALSGTALGAAVGGISGTLIGLGLSELEAKRFESLLHSGKVLVAVHLDNPEPIQRVRDIFQKAGAEDISVSRDSKARDEKSPVAPAECSSPKPLPAPVPAPAVVAGGKVL